MSTEDSSQAAALERARAMTYAAGAADLERRPWQHADQPLSDADLVRFVAWRANDAETDIDVLQAGLGLLDTARAELDQIEAALLFAARAQGMTFQSIARVLGLGSGQAAQQRMHRVLDRLNDGGAS